MKKTLAIVLALVLCLGALTACGSKKDSGDKTITVQIEYRKHHPKYGKMMTISKKLHCHDEKNECGLGDTVRVMETRPLSKTKRWRVVEIVERAK